MSTLTSKQAESEDQFRYGWRDVWTVGPDGQNIHEQIPLTEEDILHPQEPDFFVNSPAHNQDRSDLATALRLGTDGVPGMLVLTFCRIDWGVEGLLPHGPDLVLLAGVQDGWDGHKVTFCPKAHQARPLLVIEITSDSTRNVDLNAKVIEYHKAGIPLYVIVDHLAGRSEPEYRLIGYQYTPQRYVRMPLDSRGRLRLEPLQVWLGWENNRVVAFHEKGERVPNGLELLQRWRAAQERIAAAKDT